jgi:hypothetical protein
MCLFGRTPRVDVLYVTHTVTVNMRMLLLCFIYVFYLFLGINKYCFPDNINSTVFVIGRDEFVKIWMKFNCQIVATPTLNQTKMATFLFYGRFSFIKYSVN